MQLGESLSTHILEEVSGLGLAPACEGGHVLPITPPRPPDGSPSQNHTCGGRNLDVHNAGRIYSSWLHARRWGRIFPKDFFIECSRQPSAVDASRRGQVRVFCGPESGFWGLHPRGLLSAGWRIRVGRRPLAWAGQSSAPGAWLAPRRLGKAWGCPHPTWAIVAAPVAE